MNTRKFFALPVKIADSKQYVSEMLETYQDLKELKKVLLSIIDPELDRESAQTDLAELKVASPREIVEKDPTIVNMKILLTDFVNSSFKHFNEFLNALIVKVVAEKNLSKIKSQNQGSSLRIGSNN